MRFSVNVYFHAFRRLELLWMEWSTAEYVLMLSSHVIPFSSHLTWFCHFVVSLLWPLHAESHDIQEVLHRIALSISLFFCDFFPLWRMSAILSVLLFNLSHLLPRPCLSHPFDCDVESCHWPWEPTFTPFIIELCHWVDCWDGHVVLFQHCTTHLYCTVV